MKTISTVLLIAAGAAVLAAVWVPGAWWQWAITAIVLFLAGAGTGGAAAQRESQTAVNRANLPEQTVRHDRPTYGKPDQEEDK